MPELTLDSLVDDGQYASERARIENQALLEELDRKKRARTTAVPTDDNKVKARLREIGEPITLFGERAADRRDRLIYVLSQINAARGEEGGSIVAESDSEDSEEEQEEFYTPGSLELLEARRRIAEFSLPRAQKRIAQQQEEHTMPLSQILEIRKQVFTHIKTYANLGSQVGDERPISQVRFSPNGEILATGGWGGNVRLWNIPSCTPMSHSDRVGGIAWHPKATIGQSEDAVNFVSGGAGECTVNLWSLKSETPLAIMKGHQDRVCRVAFHPSGNYVASASFDSSWRLWDVETAQELLLQEGHSREVYAIDFQGDGALVASGGLDAIGRVWDLRTGRTAMVLDGHVNTILSISFSPNGYQLATGGADDTIRIWDMRSLKAIYTIPAHKSNVSDVRFYRALDLPKSLTSDSMVVDGEGEDPEAKAEKDTSRSERYKSGLYLVSAGFDGFIKLWSADDWQLQRAIPTDAGKIMSVDISSDAKYIASGSYNRSYQLFSPEEAVI
ncbi:hypothetical protein M422DRAFT_151784 [Sphaerobolus stellatus SS14]|nr:hypothetical protein M422DRAFT_151784 [Sphaerobolus stellatus SS14]